MDRFALYTLILGFLVSGCSNIPQADDNFVACVVENRIGSKAEWKQERCQARQVPAFIAETLAHELTADAAIQIALLNNPNVQATFEELGIAQANLVEAGLLSNPSFEIEIRYPHKRYLRTNIEYLITSSFLDIFLIPLRTRLASTEFEQTKLRVSHEILDVAFEVRETYYELMAEEQKTHYLQSILELTSIISDLSAKQITVGNINKLEFQLDQTKFFEFKIELEQSQAEIIHLREKLKTLMGFSEDVYLMIPKTFSDEIDYQGFDLCILESVALQERLDLQVARFEITRLSQMLGLKEGWTYTNLETGLAGERDPDGAHLIGPGFSGQFPIFNYGQAARMRLFAQLRQAQDHLADLEIHVLSQIREAHKLLTSYLKIIHYYKNLLLPMQNQISVSSEELYNVMGLGIDKLLENKRQELVSNKNYLDSIKKFLVVRVSLDRALGGNLFKLISQRECLSKN